MVMGWNGSLGKAARALRRGPAIGRHLHQLELNVSARRFERSANRHRLTREDKELLPMAQSMADAIGLGAIGGAIYGARVFVDAHPEAKTDARCRCGPWVAWDGVRVP